MKTLAKLISIILVTSLMFSLSGCASFWEDPDTANALRVINVPAMVVLPNGGTATALVPMHY